MKQCNKCSKYKSLDNFYKRYTKKDGTIVYRAECKECRLVVDKAKYWSDGHSRVKIPKAESREEYLSRRRATYSNWREANQEYNAQRCREWREANEDKRKEYNQINKHKILSNTRKRQARLKNQTPDLTSVEKYLIDSMYLVASILTNTCEEPFEVDHIIPLARGGLHSFDNLQILTRAENRAKHTKLPCELL